MLTLLFITFFLMLLVAMPVAFAMSGSAILALVAQGQVPLTLVVQRIYAGADSFPLLAIPFFIIAGEVMTQSGMTDSLVDLCEALLGHLRNGLASVSILACMIFAGISGSGSADAAAIGTVMTPQLVGKGYPKGLAASIIATGGALGPIIPPSILMILYGAIAEQSVGKLFLAGFMPGALIGLGLMGVSYLWNLQRGWEAGSGRKPSIRVMVRALGRATLPLVTPAIIIGGIVGGIFTATEAGVVATVYALAAAVLTGRMSLGKIKAVLVRSGLLSSLSLFVVSMASIFGWIMAREGFPSTVSETLLRISGGNSLLAASYVILVLLVLGFFVEVIAMMIIFVPVLAPLAPALGFDPIHWGLLMVMAMNVGGVTPPVGTNLFIAASIARCSLGEISRYVMPFVAVFGVIIFLVLLFPSMALWVPRIFFPEG
jgi:C4-dicarboxylate transporter DctM subunit